MTTVYVTTANYALDVAITANNIATTANNLVNSISDAGITIDSIYSLATQAYSNAIAANSNAATAQANAATAQANAATANTLAFTANNVATQAYLIANTANNIANLAFPTANTANNIANLAFPTANTANNIANLAFPTANTANIIANLAYLTSNIANNNANYANAILNTGLVDNVTNANNIANLAYPTANTANNIANLAYPTADTANNIANLAYPTADTANNIANLAYTTADTANIMAITANATANIAYITAYNANILATSTNNFITQVATIYNNILNSGYSFWSNSNSNTYILTNVAIGKTTSSNALDVIGNVYISGNLYVGGSGGGQGIFTNSSSGLFKFPNDVIRQPIGPSGEIIIPFSSMTPYGVTSIVPNSNSLSFPRIGVYTVTISINGQDADTNYDTVGSVNVYTNTNDTMIGASRIYSDQSSVTFGPIKQNLIIPLNVDNVSNNYIFGINFFRTNSGTTIKGGNFNASYVQVTPLMGGGVPITPDFPTIIYQNVQNVGINQSNPQYTLDVNGPINSTSLYLNGSQFIYSANDGYQIYQNTIFTKNLTVGQNVSANYIFANVYYANGAAFNRGTGNIWTTSSVGIGTSSVSNALTVNGSISASSNIFAKYFFGDITKSIGYYYPFSQWLLGTGNAWTLSNIGIGTSSVSNTLTVNGNVSANYIFANISFASGFINSPLNLGTGNSWTLSNIGIGTSSVSNTLTVNGNVSANNYYGNIYYVTGTMFNRGTNNVWTSSNVGIGTPSVGNALTVNGNVYITGTLKAESTFIVACSDEVTPLVRTEQAVSFRTPGTWALTRVPRITLTTPTTTGYVNVNVNINNSGTDLYSSNIYIFQSSPTPLIYSSAFSQQPSLTSGASTIIPDDTLVKIRIKDPGTNATGLKIIFYYMNV
jgi:hypothetical protein